MKNSLLIALAAVVLVSCSQAPTPASTPSVEPSASASASPSPGERRRGGFSERLKNSLGLTDAQMTELQPLFDEQRDKSRKIMQDFRDEMSAVLTDEQRARLKELDKQAREDGERRQPPWEELELTGPQAIKLEELRQKVRDQNVKSREEMFAKLASKLTAEQKVKLEELKTRMRERAREREEGN